MALSNSEKQRQYRQRHLQDGTACELRAVVEATAKAALERLARHRKATQRQVLESLLAEAEARTVRRMTETARREYFADCVTQ